MSIACRNLAEHAAIDGTEVVEGLAAAPGYGFATDEVPERCDLTLISSSWIVTHRSWRDEVAQFERHDKRTFVSQMRRFLVGITGATECNSVQRKKTRRSQGVEWAYKRAYSQRRLIFKLLIWAVKIGQQSLAPHASALPGCATSRH
jgi:hypothetical protein